MTIQSWLSSHTFCPASINYYCSLYSIQAAEHSCCILHCWWSWHVLTDPAIEVGMWSDAAVIFGEVGLWSYWPCCGVFQLVGQLPPPCPTCGKRYLNAATLQQHIQVIHHSVYTCYCLRCHQAFPNNAYQAHLKSHQDQPVQCFTCADSFPNENELQGHRQVCPKNAPNTPCPWCGKQFNILSNLKTHVESIHLKTIVFRCTCGTNFFWKMSFRRHIACCQLVKM